MDGYKLASVAGMVTMAASMFVESAMVRVNLQTQPGQTQPGQTQPGQTQPGQTRPGQPGQPGQPRPGEIKPGQPDRTQPGTIRGTMEQPSDEKSMFQLREQSAERKLQELGRELARMEEQMKESRQQLANQLNQVRLLSGDQKVDALAEVVQGLNQQHMQLGDYLTQLRESITGHVSAGRLQGIPEPNEGLDEEIKEIKEDLRDPLKAPKDPLDHPKDPVKPGDPGADPGMPR